jgi:hypothetical protein
MRVYRHSARCYMGLRSFLECNPMYWCFIPQLWNDSMMLNFDCTGEPLERDSEVNYLVQRGVIENPRVAYYLRRVPLPPAQYIFSYQQRQQQRFFFRNLVNNVYDGIPYCPMDLYQYKVIVVCKYFELAGKLLTLSRNRTCSA